MKKLIPAILLAVLCLCGCRDSGADIHTMVKHDDRGKEILRVETVYNDRDKIRTITVFRHGYISEMIEYSYNPDKTFISYFVKGNVVHYEEADDILPVSFDNDTATTD